MMNRCVGIVLNLRLWMGGLMRLMKGTIFWKTRVTWLLDINSMTRSFINWPSFLHYNWEVLQRKQVDWFQSKDEGSRHPITFRVWSVDYGGWTDATAAKQEERVCNANREGEVHYSKQRKQYTNQHPQPLHVNNYSDPSNTQCHRTQTEKRKTDIPSSSRQEASRRVLFRPSPSRAGPHALRRADSAVEICCWLEKETKRKFRLRQRTAFGG